MDCNNIYPEFNAYDTDANDTDFNSSLPIFVMSIGYALEMRYGFLERFPPGWPDFGNQPLSDEDWYKLCKIYVERPSSRGASSHFRSTVRHFTEGLLSLDSNKPSSFPFHYIWDLLRSHPVSIYSKILASQFVIKPLVFGDETMYELKSKSTDAHLEVNYHLVIEDGLTALQCIRMGWGPGLKDIAMGLVTIGATFHMFQTAPTRVLGEFGAPLLRYCPKEYKPTVGDYAQYVEMRKAVLQEARCRAAITRGGILWRLAVESLFPGLIIDKTIKIDLLQYGCARSYTSEGVEYWEDALTEADEMAICGVYHVYTGNGQQTAHKSWWPKPGIWAVKGLNVGYWSAGCEHWYRQRLEMIKQGKAGLRSASEWMTALTFQVKKTRKLVGRHEEAARKVISGE